MQRRWEADDDRGGPPQPGLYLLKLGAGRPWVPARILHQDGLWSAEIDGAPAGLPEEDPDRQEAVMRIWHGGRRSDDSEHAYLAAVKRWAADNQPEHPLLHPTKRIDLNRLPPVLP